MKKMCLNTWFLPLDGHFGVYCQGVFFKNAFPASLEAGFIHTSRMGSCNAIVQSTAPKLAIGQS
ncbi:hypothetical protein DP117_09155 [Brasilonema sp. UFV-L1]|nr:hypothetical protein [Brasilonema sp. UFV-L1]